MPASPATSWAALLPAALAGTHRQLPPVLPGLTPSLGTEAGAPEKQLLLTAASLCLVRQAGQQPQPGPAETLAPPEAPEWPAAGPGVDALLAEVVAAPDVPELLRALLQLRNARQRLPTRRLAAVVYLLATSDSLYYLPMLAPVLGRRGYWLAGLHPRLAYLARPTLPSEAYTGKAAGAKYWLDLWQYCPTLALRETEHAWPAASPDEQEQLVLHAFRANQANQLSPAPARQLAAVLARPASRDWTPPTYLIQLLAQVPGHPTQAQLWVEASPYLKAERDAAGVLRLAVYLDEAPQDDMYWGPMQQVEWLIGESGKPRRRFPYQQPRPPVPSPHLYQQAGWLGRRLCLLPPRRWAEAWQLTPAQLTGLVADSSHPDMLRTAWLHATLLHGDLDFARALLAQPFSQDTYRLQWELFVARLLPAPELLAWVDAQLAARADFPSGRLYAVEWPDLLTYLLPVAQLGEVRSPTRWPRQPLPHPAEAALLARLLAAVARLAAEADSLVLTTSQKHYLYRLVQHLASVATPDLLPAAEAALGALAAGTSFIAPDLRQLLATLRQRHALAAALAAPGH